jgi:hypothetical protein
LLPFRSSKKKLMIMTMQTQLVFEALMVDVSNIFPLDELDELRGVEVLQDSIHQPSQSQIHFIQLQLSVG